MRRSPRRLTHRPVAPSINTLEYPCTGVQGNVQRSPWKPPKRYIPSSGRTSTSFCWIRRNSQRALSGCTSTPWTRPSPRYARCRCGARRPSALPPLTQWPLPRGASKPPPCPGSSPNYEVTAPRWPLPGPPPSTSAGRCSDASTPRTHAPRRTRRDPASSTWRTPCRRRTSRPTGPSDVTARNCSLIRGAS